MTVADIINFLRLNVKVQNSEVNDPQFLNMTDADLTLYLEVVKTRDFAKYPTLDSLPQECIYPLVLLAKKELYFALASSNAPLFDLVADNNNQLKRSDRFKHYMSLIAQVDSEYKQYVSDGGAGHNTLTSFDVLLSNRYYTKRNHELGYVPVLSLYVDSFSSTTIELSWEMQVSMFLSSKVYISTSKIYDEYLPEKINPNAQLVATYQDNHITQCRLTGLVPNTLYYILLVVTDKTTLKGYREVSISTTP